jgi:hypothetical protein
MCRIIEKGSTNVGECIFNIAFYERVPPISSPPPPPSSPHPHET